MKLLYDLVYNKENENETAVGIDGGDVTAEDGPRHRIAGMAVDVKRGSSLDVGVLIDVEARQRCSIECWYHPPGMLSIGCIILIEIMYVPSRGSKRTYVHIHTV